MTQVELGTGCSYSSLGALGAAAQAALNARALAMTKFKISGFRI